MKRSGFKRQWQPREARQMDYTPRPRTPVTVAAALDREIRPQPKDRPIRDEAYRRRVSRLACINCGIVGFSQCAHGPVTGLGIKASDVEVFPLCCDRPGVVGCHSKFDQYLLFDAEKRRIMARAWSQDTRARLERDEQAL